jgi:hypothetical protein
MTTNPETNFESRLEAFGLALTGEAGVPAPAAFVDAVRQRRSAIVLRRVGLGGGAAVLLTALVIVAQSGRSNPARQNPGPVLMRMTPGTPTFSSLRSIEDVDASTRGNFSVSSPVVKAGDRPDGEAVKALSDFK